jgi:hypothetical protein
MSKLLKLKEIGVRAHHDKSTNPDRIPNGSSKNNTFYRYSTSGDDSKLLHDKLRKLETENRELLARLKAKDDLIAKERNTFNLQN